MGQDSEKAVTRLLAQWRQGDESALGELTPLLYEELRALARRHLRRERPDHTMQRTALVHEAFLRLVNQQSVDWQSRGHFFSLASNIMRRILVDHARARAAFKRGNGVRPLSLDDVGEIGDSSDGDGGAAPEATPALLAAVVHDADVDVTALDEALTRLADFDPRQAQIVEMRYFGGLTIEETANALELSDATIKREWTLARAWLRLELAAGD